MLSRSEKAQIRAKERIVFAGLEDRYKDYAAECRAALRVALTTIQNLEEALDRGKAHNPFDSIDSRIKTFDSVMDKCLARGYEQTIDDIKSKVKDVAGIRIITEYVDDIVAVSEMLCKTQGLNVSEVKDYVKNPKENGYSGIHLICNIQIPQLGGGTQIVPVEIQVRTWAMDLWAKYEHKFKYKNQDPLPNIDDEFASASEFVREFDNKMMELRNAAATAKNLKIHNGAISKIAPEVEEI